MVYLGLDLGSKTLGVSVSDRTGIIASSLEVLRYNEYSELLEKLDAVLEEYKMSKHQAWNYRKRVRSKILEAINAGELSELK